MASEKDLTASERRCLQGHAKRALEGFDAQRGAREGECIWHTGYPPTWSPETLNALEARGLIVVREEWKDNFVRLTAEAYALLSRFDSSIWGSDHA